MMNKKTNAIANIVVTKMRIYTNVDTPELGSSMTETETLKIRLDYNIPQSYILPSQAVKLSVFKRHPSGQMQAIRDLYSSRATQR